jgi:hypothetical protein
VEPRTDAAGDWEHRADRGELLSPRPLPNGTVLVEGYAAKAGILRYRRPDGSIRRELVTEKCLQDSAESMIRLPVTLEHPRTDRHPDGVTPDNVGELAVGDTSETIELAGGYGKLQLAVRRRDGLQALQDGVRELSSGYKALVRHDGGTHPVYGPYDSEQIVRIYNHVALVPKGRAGPDVGVRYDAAICTETFTGASTPSGSSSRSAPDPSTPAASSARGARMVQLNPGFTPLLMALAVEQRVDTDDAALSVATSAARARNEAHARELKAKGDELSTLQARHDDMKTKLDAANAETARLKGELKKREDAAERGELEPVAKRFSIDPKKHVDNKDLKKAIAQAHLGKAYRQDGDDAYINVAVDLAKRDDSARDEGRRYSRSSWDDAGGRHDDEGGDWDEDGDDRQDRDEDEDGDEDRGHRQDRDDPPPRSSRARGGSRRGGPRGAAELNLDRYTKAHKAAQRGE